MEFVEPDVSRSIFSIFEVMSREHKEEVDRLNVQHQRSSVTKHQIDHAVNLVMVRLKQVEENVSLIYLPGKFTTSAGKATRVKLEKDSAELVGVYSSGTSESMIREDIEAMLLG